MIPIVVRRVDSARHAVDMLAGGGAGKGNGDYDRAFTALMKAIQDYNRCVTCERELARSLKQIELPTPDDPRHGMRIA